MYKYSIKYRPHSHLRPIEARTMGKTTRTINLLKPLQEEVNKALRNPLYAFTHAENPRRGIGCFPVGHHLEIADYEPYPDLPEPIFRPEWIRYLQTGKLIHPPFETHTDADPGYWYFIDDSKIKIMEEDMDETRIRMTTYASGDELQAEVSIEIKNGHILAELGCEKYICHNLVELLALIKKALLRNMPILKDFGKAKEPRFSPRREKALRKALDEGRKEGTKQAEAVMEEQKILYDKKLRKRTVKQQPSDTQKT